MTPDRSLKGLRYTTFAILAITVTSIVSRLCVQFTSADVVITPGVSSSSCHGPLTPYFYWTGLLFIQLILSTTSMVALDRKEISLFTLTSYSATGLAVVYFVISAYFGFLLVSLNKFEEDEITFDDYNYGDYDFPSIPIKCFQYSFMLTLSWTMMMTSLCGVMGIYACNCAKNAILMNRRVFSLTRDLRAHAEKPDELKIDIPPTYDELFPEQPTQLNPEDPPPFSAT